MKTAIIVAANPMLLVIYGCKRENLNPTNQQTTFKFKANGVEFIWNGSLADTINKTGGAVINKDNFGRYVLTASETAMPFSMNVMYLSITSENKLQTKTYNYSTSNLSGLAATLSLKNNGDAVPRIYTNWDNGNVSITITKLNNGFASGNFSATLGDNMRITAGEFNNVKVLE